MSAGRSPRAGVLHSLTTLDLLVVGLIRTVTCGLDFCATELNSRIARYSIFFLLQQLKGIFYFYNFKYCHTCVTG